MIIVPEKEALIRKFAGRKIRFYRKKAKMTQDEFGIRLAKELGKKADIQATTISNWEYGRVPIRNLEAIAKVLETIASPEVGIALANKSNCAPANSKAYDDADVAANEMIMAMKATAETAQPMPNIPQMSVMWGPTEEFLAAVNKSGEDIDTAAETYQQEALDAIADMQ